MRFAIPDYLLRVKEEASFYLARELGFDGIELTADRVGDEQQLLFRREALAELAMLRDATGVTVCSIFATQFLHENLVDPNPGEQSRHALSLAQLLSRAAVLGIPMVVVPVFGLRSTGQEEMARLRQLLRQLGDRPQPAPALALKTMLPAEKLLELPDEAGPMPVGVCFDPGAAVAVRRDPVAEASLLAGRILHVQLSDRNCDGAAVPIGDGHAQTPRFLCELSRLGYAGDVVLHGPAGISAVESARRNLRVCRQWLATAA